MLSTSTFDKFTSSLPVDVEGLAREVGLTLVEKEMSENISGGLRKINDHFELFVNASHPETRRRFTIAHEIGHYVLHSDLLGTGVDDDTAYRRTDSEKFNCNKIGKFEEAQANQFAAELLMPRKMVVGEFRKNKVLASLSQVFQVSQDALKIRLRQLHLD